MNACITNQNIKVLVVCIALLSISSHVLSDSLNYEVNTLISNIPYGSPRDLHREIVNLRIKADRIVNSILFGNNYRPDDLSYAISLETILSVIPDNYRELPSCNDLISHLKLNENVVRWDNVSNEVKELWPLLAHLCAYSRSDRIWEELCDENGRCEK